MSVSEIVLFLTVISILGNGSTLEHLERDFIIFSLGNDFLINFLFALNLSRIFFFNEKHMSVSEIVLFLMVISILGNGSTLEHLYLILVMLSIDWTDKISCFKIFSRSKGIQKDFERHTRTVVCAFIRFLGVLVKESQNKKANFAD
jgi:hypothetical protein